MSKQIIDAFEQSGLRLYVLKDDGREGSEFGNVVMRHEAVPPGMVGEIVRLARLGLEAELRTKTHEDRCVAFVATLDRALVADKATFRFYSFDGLTKLKIETSSFTGFKGEGHGPLEALDDAIEADGWKP